MKRAILQISDVLLVQILKGLLSGFSGRFKVSDNGLPEDTKVIESYSVDGRIDIIVESELFENVKELHKLPPFPVLDSPVISTVPEKDPIMWLCGQFRKETDIGNIWDFRGLFHLRDDAIKACKTENYFVVPLEIGKELPEEIKDWPVIEYPLRESNDTS